METDNVPRGPRRWERAAKNAALEPESAAAQLFFDRVVAARHIAATHTGFALDPYPKAHYEWTYNNRSGDVSWVRKYFTCGVEHAVMQLALDVQSTDTTVLRSRFIEPYPLAPHVLARDDWSNEALMKEWRTEQIFVTPTMETPTRSARCQVCGITITPDGDLEGDVPYMVTAEEHRATPKLDALVSEPAVFEPPAPDTTVYIADQFGHLEPVSGAIIVLDLTEAEYEIAKYLDYDGVESLLRDRGREVR